mmetsp:Transcript_38037/g.39518  ORF Transcript_38037/g.39518 Transcript_38037/m.39518 type:complete len:693 (+) Transcript_38037:17-2095(+)
MLPIFKVSLMKTTLLVVLVISLLMSSTFTLPTNSTAINEDPEGEDSGFEIEEHSGHDSNYEDNAAFQRRINNRGPNTIFMKESNKTEIQWLYISSEHFLGPKNDFTNPRPVFEVKPEKVSHIIVNEQHENHHRVIDLERLKDFFGNHEEIQGELLEGLHLTGSRSVNKQILLIKLRDFFNDQIRKNKVLFLSGVCNTDGDFEYIDNNMEDRITLSYEEVFNLWLSRDISKRKTELLIVIDCPYSGLWTQKCNDEYHYKDLSIQASSTNDESSYDIQGYGSLFLNNFLHAQHLYDKTFTNELLKSYDLLKNETDINPILENKYDDSQERKEGKRGTGEEKTILPNSRMIHLYQQTPSSCGMPFYIALHYNLNALFNSWDEIVVSDNYYKEKNFTEINSLYKGEYNQGQPNGRGSLWYMGTQEQYLGDFVYSQKQGRGTFFFNDTTIFDGVWRMEKKVKGVLHGSMGDWYAGEFKENAFHGQGSLYNKEKNYIYIGQFENGQQNGHGETSYPSGGKYVGEHKNNLFHGKGKFYVNGTLVSESQYKEGERHGKGWFFLREGHNYTGNFRKGMAEGEGTMKFTTGDIYEGEFSKGKPNGEGVFYYQNGNIYEGPVKNGRRHGFGKLSIQNGDIYEGTFTEDALTGEGTLYYERGIYKGQFLEGRFHGQGTVHLKSGGRYQGEFREGKIYREEDEDL